MARRVNVMLLGKTGHGKSSTANTLVNGYVFDDSDGSESATKNVSAHTIKLGDIIATVVDTPGMRDTKTYNPATETANAVRYMESALDYCTDGIHLFLLVLPYGSRHTEEEAAAIRDITRTNYGQEVIKRCTVLFTHGDDFVIKNRGKDIKSAFEGWCKQQGGALGELLESTGYRHFLCDNLRYTDEDKGALRSNVFEAAASNRKSKGSFTKEFFKSLLTKIKDAILGVAARYCNIL